MRRVKRPYHSTVYKFYYPSFVLLYGAWILQIIGCSLFGFHMYSLGFWFNRCRETGVSVTSKHFSIYVMRNYWKSGHRVPGIKLQIKKNNMFYNMNTTIIVISLGNLCVMRSYWIVSVTILQPCVASLRQEGVLDNTNTNLCLLIKKYHAQSLQKHRNRIIQSL